MAKILDTVTIGGGKVEYTVESIEGDVAQLLSIIKGTKRSAEVSKLKVVREAPVVNERLEVKNEATKVSWVKRAVRRVKGKRGGKLRNA